MYYIQISEAKTMAAEISKLKESVISWWIVKNIEKKKSRYYQRKILNYISLFARKYKN